MPDGFYLTPDYKSRIDALIRRFFGGGSHVPGQIEQTANYNLVPFKCAAACPAWGVMRITGATLDSDNVFRLDTAQPNTTLQRYYLVNMGEDAVNDGSGNYYGTGTHLEAANHVLYDTGNTPAYGEGWGPQDGTWTIKKGRWGFTINGGNGGTGATSRTTAVQHVVNHVLGKTNASHAKGASGTVNLYAGTLGSETQVTSMTVTAYNRFATVASGKWVHCTWVNGGWDLSAAECP